MDQAFWDQALQALLLFWPGAGYVLLSLGSLVVLGGIYVGLTPSKEDDMWWEKLEAIPYLGALLRALAAFSPIQRK